MVTDFSPIQTLGRRSLRTALIDIIHHLTTSLDCVWGTDQYPVFAVDSQGRPAVQISAANCSLDFDPWIGLKNPALAGLYPIRWEQLWAYYAYNTRTNTDNPHRTSVFKIPESYEQAQQKFGRVVIMSVMLPISHHIAELYADQITSGSAAPLVGYKQAIDSLNQLLNQAVTLLAHRVVSSGRAVIPMTKQTVAAVMEQTVPLTHQGDAHGPCKSVNYPQKSMAVLTGLGQFGVHRLVIVDRQVDGKVVRYLGPLSSLVIFDHEQPVATDDMLHLTDNWQRSLLDLHYGQDTAHKRFCGYYNGTCSRCFSACPDDAIRNSAPMPDNSYPQSIADQQYRFWEGHLQFDYRRCTTNRNNLATIHGDWICNRCLAVCAAKGTTNPEAAIELP